jgi:osmoprotectant transport system permease protein
VGAGALWLTQAKRLQTTMDPFIDAFKFIAHNGQIPGQPPVPTLVHYTLGTAKVAVIAMAISLVIALPIGVWLGHIHRGSFVAINLGNIWRALPSLAVLAIGVAILGLGLKNVLLALVVLAVPPIITNCYVGIDQVDPDVVDAARGMGMTGWQILRLIELPLAVPLVMAGIRISTLFVVSTTTISALTGYADSLGEIVNDEASYHLAGVLGAAICIAILALGIEALLALVQRALTPVALRRTPTDTFEEGPAQLVAEPALYNS